MEQIPATEAERTMKVQEVILRAMAKKISWWQAAEILGISERTMRRWKFGYETHGFRALYDKRKGKPSWRKTPTAEVERVMALYREHYADLNVVHFHEKLAEEHGIHWSYTWVKNVLQDAGLVKKIRCRRKHLKRRPRKPLSGMMLHIDGSHHRWFQDDRWYDLIVILDDATSEIYYAQLVEDEATRSVMAALRHVVESQGWFATIYSDRAGHFFQTPKAGGPVDTRQLTQVGRAMKELGIRMIPAYSPQARGRSERSFGTWQGRLPQELRLRQIKTLEAANQFLREAYIAEFNRKFARPAAQTGTAFVPLKRQDLDRVFSVQHERVVNKDNTVRWANHFLQIEPTLLRSTMADLEVTVYEHLDGTLTIGYGPHTLGGYSAEGEPLVPTPTRRPTRDGHRLPFRPKRSALRAALGSTPADAHLLSKTNEKTKQSGNKRVLRVGGGR
jgi:transposase